MPRSANDQFPDLDAMFEEMLEAPEIVRPSRFWQTHAELQLKDLEASGFDEFKRTLNRWYFQFVVADPRDPQYRAVLGAWLRRPSLAPLRAGLLTPVHSSGSPADSPRPSVPARVRSALRDRSHALYVTLLCRYVRSRDEGGLLDRLDEPSLGHPVTFDYLGRRISEDLCNSVLEYTSIVEALPGGPPTAGTVIELGSGYGRLAWVFLQALPGVRYVLVDIPPALAIAERYLTELFPERRAFTFRRFATGSEVERELTDAQIIFLTPNQLELLAPQQADLFINVSSLHEMHPSQIDHYFSVIDRHTAGCFYTKQWQRSVNPFDGIVVTHEDYPVPARWRTLFDRRHPVQRLFFEALYDLSHR